MKGPKFRAWIERYQKYMPVSLINFDPISGKIVSIEVVATGGDWCKFYPEEYVLEQDTGLKDKNAKPIYQGDIVEALIDGAWSVGKNGISFGEVKWKLEVIHNDIRFMDVFKVIGSKSNPYRIYYLFDQALSELEVIGNIHENQDLLGDTNVTDKEEE